MGKFVSILYDTFLEIKNRKIFYLYWIVAIFMVALLALIPDLQFNGMKITDGEMIPTEFVEQAVARIFDGFFGFMIFIMIFGSAGLLPAYLSKGRVELALSKPINRFKLISMKFLSVFLILSVVLIITSLAVWLTIYLRIGSQVPGFIYGLLYAVFQFLIVYSIVFFFGMISNSAGFAIIGYFMTYVVSQLLSGRELVYGLLGETVWKDILDGAYHILPKITELSNNYLSLMIDKSFSDTYPLLSTMMFSIVLYLASLLVFKRRDY